MWGVGGAGPGLPSRPRETSERVDADLALANGLLRQRADEVNLLRAERDALTGQVEAVRREVLRWRGTTVDMTDALEFAWERLRAIEEAIR